jgi:hypothetical protein
MQLHRIWHEHAHILDRWHRHARRLRYSGVEHDGCPKGCMIFWREAWLRKVQDAAVLSADLNSGGPLSARLQTKIDAKTYFCQASEILKATRPLSRWERLGKCFSEVRVGNCMLLEMTHRISIWLFWRIRRVLLGAYARGKTNRRRRRALMCQPD